MQPGWLACAGMQDEPESRERAPRVVIVGVGPIGDALTGQAELLGWSATTTTGLDESVAAVGHLESIDAVIVQDHEHRIATPVLTTALRGAAGYVGALGSRRMQGARLGSLRRAGVTEDELADLHCPTGLDLGARTPAESAVSIVAEIIAARSGRDPASLRATSNRITA